MTDVSTMFTLENQPRKTTRTIMDRAELKAIYTERMELEREKLKLEERRVAAVETLLKLRDH